MSIGPVTFEVDELDDTIDLPVAVAVKTELTVKWSIVPPCACSTSLLMVSTDVPGTTPHQVLGYGPCTCGGAAELAAGTARASAVAAVTLANKNLNWNMWPPSVGLDCVWRSVEAVLRWIAHCRASASSVSGWYRGGIVTAA